MVRERGLPGELAVDEREFRDALRRVGLDGLIDLASIWLDAKYAQLLSVEPGTEYATLELARAQGVSRFLRWIEERKRELDEKRTVDFVPSV